MYITSINTSPQALHHVNHYITSRSGSDGIQHMVRWGRDWGGCCFGGCGYGRGLKSSHCGRCLIGSDVRWMSLCHCVLWGMVADRRRMAVQQLPELWRSGVNFSIWRFWRHDWGGCCFGSCGCGHGLLGEVVRSKDGYRWQKNQNRRRMWKWKSTGSHFMAYRRIAKKSILLVGKRLHPPQ